MRVNTDRHSCLFQCYVFEILISAFVLCGISSCSERSSNDSKLWDKSSNDSKPWDEFVVYERAVAPYTLDRNVREFSGRVLIQGVEAGISHAESDLVLASIDSYEWSQEYRDRWRAKEDVASLYEDLPVPSHCWELDEPSRSAAYTDAGSWMKGADFVLVDRLSAEPRFAHAVRERHAASRPKWWPDDLILNEIRNGQFGRVMPGKEAVYYVSSGVPAGESYDMWGSIPHYMDSVYIVISNAQSSETQIAVFELEAQGKHGGVSALVDQEGDWMIVKNLDKNRFWLIHLGEVWKAFEGEG